MSKSEEIRKAIQGLVIVPTQVFAAEVVAVDEELMTVEVQPVDQAEVDEVRLKAGIDGVNTGMVEFPTKGSQVLVGLIGNDDDTCMVLKCSQVDKIVINGGENGGLTITPELVTQLGKMSNRVDKIYDAIANGTPIAQDGGIGYQQSMGSILQGVESEDFSSIENDKITH